MVALSCSAVTPDVLEKLAFGDSDAKNAALATIINSADESAIPLLQALADDTVQTGPDKKVYVVKDGKGVDAATGKPVDPLP